MEPKKKIIQMIRTLEVGGCEGALLRMLPYIQDDFEHIILTLQQKGSLTPLFEKQNIRVVPLNQKSFLDIASYFRLRKILKDLHPDLIVTNLLHADIIGRLFVQFFVPCHVVSSLVTTYNFGPYWPARLFERMTKYLAFGYMANAESVKTAYVEKFGVKSEKISVLPRGIDTESFLHSEPDENLKKTLGILPDDYVVICVANLHPNKGHCYLLTAFEELFQTHPNIKLLLAGEGQEKENLLRQVANYRSKSHILFLGKRSDVPKLLQISDVFVLPTFFEGMSNAIMEAMANNLPIITTDIPENRELVTHEKMGLLCPVKDVVSLTQALERLIKDSVFSQTLGNNAAQKMQTEYNFTVTSLRWRNFFLAMSKK